MTQDTQLQTKDPAQKKADNELALQNFGRELKRLRKLRGLTQKELSEITGIDSTVISDMENGKYTPSLNFIQQLSVALNVTPFLLVASYYGIEIPTYSPKDKEIIEKFVAVALEYLNSQGQSVHLPIPPTPPSNIQQTQSPRPELHPSYTAHGERALNDLGVQSQKQKTKPKNKGNNKEETGENGENQQPPKSI